MGWLHARRGAQLCANSSWRMGMRRGRSCADAHSTVRRRDSIVSPIKSFVIDLLTDDTPLDDAAPAPFSMLGAPRSSTVTSTSSGLSRQSLQVVGRGSFIGIYESENRDGGWNMHMAYRAGLRCVIWRWCSFIRRPCTSAGSSRALDYRSGSREGAYLVDRTGTGS
jgi:hypothetical protein